MRSLIRTDSPALPLSPIEAGRHAPRLQDPRRELIAGGALIGLFVFGFIGWSAVARLDAAVHSAGVVRVAGERQSVQAAAPGLIARILVHEGDRVKAGQLLVEFVGTEQQAQERSLANRVFGLQAEIARIEAERTGARRVAPPAAWQSLTLEDRETAMTALAHEQANLDARQGLLSAQRAVLGQRVAEVGDQIEGYRERQSSNAKQSELNKDELASVQDLYRQGYATKSRVLALQRNAASIEGDMGAANAEMARLRSTAGETRLQMMQLDSQHQQENADRERTAQTELQSLLPQWRAARDQRDLSEVRAPVGGVVLGLATHTVGGVVAAGQKLMDIVPSDAALVIESQVAPTDANDLHPGQKADVRINMVGGRNLPALHGTVTRVSADSLTDEKSGRSFFTAQVRVPRSELDAVSREAGYAGTIRPGTPAEVSVPLKPRTALQYWIGPLTSRFSRALTER
ncbi:HlyD family type I secretion periplasmic adaptor subunit [Sphingomonas morindae]|uniref:Membrane fusion protein (MFP) family protein n=1 Tax=Sphingomonas morindae TaxID=1541170 RepID=A0ABY4X6I2_9SPHN|nr:HlyD family type I secretion periplasmic adaptor subunit [Sphingomonas morindae]USI72454.1 HlyD family type I secretion periplasmic adaptor subunit [Sphingomonas morindae]